MSKESIEIGGGTIQELRARQKWHGYQEIELAKEIQRHIHAQAVLEYQIIAWEIYIDLLKKDLPELSVKNSDKAWSIRNGLKRWFE